MVGSEPCIGSELLDVMPGSKETTSVGSEGLEDGRRAPEKTSAQDSLEKELCGGQERGQGRTFIGKMLRVRLGASDFSSQRQKWGGGESFEGPSLPIVLMPFDGRGKSNSTGLRIKSGFQC